MKPILRLLVAAALPIGLLAFIPGCDPTQDPNAAAAQFVSDWVTFFTDFARQLLAAFLF